MHTPSPHDSQQVPVTPLSRLPLFTLAGWLAPLHLGPINFVEWFAFASTLVLTWTTAAFLLGGYSSSASTDLPRALRSTSLTWLASMPVSGRGTTAVATPHCQAAK